MSRRLRLSLGTRETRQLWSALYYASDTFLAGDDNAADRRAVREWQRLADKVQREALRQGVVRVEQ